VTEKAISAGAVDYFDRLSSVSRLEAWSANARGREGFRPIIISDVVPLDARTGRVERLLGCWNWRLWHVRKCRPRTAKAVQAHANVAIAAERGGPRRLR